MAYYPRSQDRPSSAETMFRVGRIVLAVIACATVAFAAADGIFTPRIRHAEAAAAEIAAETRDFQNTLRENASTAQKYIQSLEQGRDLSQMTVGWYVYNVVSLLASRDDELSDYIAAHGGDLRHYLETTFRKHSADEIAAIRALPGKETPALHAAAADALEALRHIPDPLDAPATRARDRRDLAQALTQLKGSLEKGTNEVDPQMSAVPPASR